MAYPVRRTPKKTWGIYKIEILVAGLAEPPEEVLIQEFDDEGEARKVSERLFWSDPKNSHNKAT
jgi:hypothetical protein